MYQTLCDVCEQPIAETYDRKQCIRLDDGGASVYGPAATIHLHLHPKCWDSVRLTFLSERQRDDEDALRTASQAREKARSWFERLLDLIWG